ncbi:velvet complex subunit B-like [Apis laboriosa]|uniref:velvet complex subunit B-like n=1 Tax=Apis laboriosa TaxID=183418 RepID=UPI001CC72737|nr:velvet complex subunit B-like [Apis laboriosa]
MPEKEVAYHQEAFSLLPPPPPPHHPHSAFHAAFHPHPHPPPPPFHPHHGPPPPPHPAAAAAAAWEHHAAAAAAAAAAAFHAPPPHPSFHEPTREHVTVDRGQIATNHRPRLPRNRSIDLDPSQGQASRAFFAISRGGGSKVVRVGR